MTSFMIYFRGFSGFTVAKGFYVLNTYNIFFDISALILSTITLLIFVFQKEKHTAQNRLFLSLAIDEFVMTLADIFGAVLIEARNPALLFWTQLANLLYHVAHALMPAIFASYVLVLTGLYKKYKKGFFISLFTPWLVLFILQLTNPFTGFFFYFDENLVYHHGKIFMLLYATAGLYITASIFYILRYRSTIPRGRGILLLIFIFLCLVSNQIQMHNPHLLVEAFAVVTMTFCLLVTIEAPSDVYNTVTGVQNRAMFLQDSVNLLKNKMSYKVIIIKILNAEYYMTNLGYKVMENIMREIAQWLVQITNNDAVYDCNNSNFVLILYGPILDKTNQILTYLVNRFSTDWLVQERVLSFETQICSVDVPKDISQLDHLMSLIDATGVKSENRVNLLRREQLSYIQRRKAVEQAIDRALQSNTFQVYFQPIWDAHANKIHSAEALIRLIDDDLGFISPEEFIPIAEKNGAITAIGQFVFEEVCKMFSLDQLHGIGVDFLEINLSTVQCMHKNLPNIFMDTLSHYNLPPSAINLEITESAAINNQETFQQTVNALRNCGFSFSLDDYGTGYSNATYIFSQDFSIIKIDKSILWEAEKKESARVVLRNTVRMIRELNKKILIEGVETEAQRRMMVDLGCDYCQGYFFSKPVPKSQFLEFCKDFNRSH